MADRVVLLDDPAPTRPAHRELPSTASPLPLVGLVGLAALVGGLSLQALGRRRE
jgi:hypothetical protein